MCVFRVNLLDLSLRSPPCCGVTSLQGEPAAATTRPNTLFQDEFEMLCRRLGHGSGIGQADGNIPSTEIILTAQLSSILSGV